MMNCITAFAPAKINLGLRITGRYPNGYHHLDTIFAPISLYDRLEVTPASRDAVRHLWPTGTSLSHKRQLEQGLTKNPLLLKVLAFMRAHFRETAGVLLPPQQVIIYKQIPSPSGLGGASSDAAALALALCEAYDPDRRPLLVSPAFLRAIAALGADIPFFLQYGLAGSAARLDGIGFELCPVEISPLTGFLVIPPFGFSTARMFARVRELDLPVAAEAPAAANFKFTLRLNEIPFSDELAGGTRIVQNDFDAVAQAVFPAESKVLAHAKKQIALALGQFLQVRWVLGMTGSGAGLFAATEARVPKQARAETARVLRTRLGGAWAVTAFATPEKIGP